MPTHKSAVPVGNKDRKVHGDVPELGHEGNEGRGLFNGGRLANGRPTPLRLLVYLPRCPELFIGHPGHLNVAALFHHVVEIDDLDLAEPG